MANIGFSLTALDVRKITKPNFSTHSSIFMKHFEILAIDEETQ